MIALVRVDERLIHGQVVVGWCSLDPTQYVVVDDEIRASDWESDLIVAGVPDGAEGEVVTIADAAAAWGDWSADGQRRVVLVGSVRTLADLHDAGVPLPSVNVGGLHGGPGRQELLNYVHLTPDELAACRHVCQAGVRLEARDVPSSSAVDVCALVGRLDAA